MYNANNEIYKVDYKFLNILLDNPIDILFILIGVVLLLWSIYNAIFGKNTRINFWVAGLGIVITVTMLLLILGIHNSSFYPSLSDMQSSLTIGKSSGSLYTLKIMSVVSLLVPVVLGYVYYVWKSMDKHKLTVEEIKNDPHSY
jgi:cytochrome d ubiquinol oxidase subunit II